MSKFNDSNYVIMECVKNNKRYQNLFIVGGNYVAQKVNDREYYIVSNVAQPTLYVINDTDMKFVEVGSFIPNEALTVKEDLLKTLKELLYESHYTKSQTIKVTDIILNGDTQIDATIVKFSDGTKVVSKYDSSKDNEDEFSEEYGLLLCLAKKLLGSYTEYEKVLNLLNQKEEDYYHED